MTDKPWRSAAKAVSWRLLGTCDTIVIAWLLSGKLKIAFSIGVVELFTKMFLYYSHERAWNKTTIGRIQPRTSDYQI
jgi:uncharacterized membrane protein